MTDFLIDGPADAHAEILLAHGAGAPMDSAFMSDVSQQLTGHGLRVVRFEFDYMAERRRSGGRRPPPRAERLVEGYRDVVAERTRSCPLIIGGKSLGGRVASMIADDLYRAGTIAGLVCLGYPFHPPAKPDRLRTAHLGDLTCPALICQGERDPFGTRQEVPGYDLSDAIDIWWAPDGDHDLKPRRQSGRSHSDNLRDAVGAIVGFVNDVAADAV